MKNLNENIPGIKTQDSVNKNITYVRTKDPSIILVYDENRPNEVDEKMVLTATGWFNLQTAHIRMLVNQALITEEQASNSLLKINEDFNKLKEIEDELIKETTFLPKSAYQT